MKSLFVIFHIYVLTFTAQETTIERNRRLFSIKAKIPTIEDYNERILKMMQTIDENLAQ